MAAASSRATSARARARWATCSSRCRRSTPCTCWAAWSRSRSWRPRAQRRRRAPPARLATLYMGFRRGRLADHLCRGVCGMRPARLRAAGARARVASAPACRRPRAAPAFTSAVTLGGRSVAPAALGTAARSTPTSAAPVTATPATARGPRRRPAPAAARPAPRHLQVRCRGRRPAAERRRLRPHAAQRPARHRDAVVGRPAAELDDLIQYVKVFAPRWRTESPARRSSHPRSLAGTRPTRSSAAGASITAWRSVRSPATRPTRRRPRSMPSPRS